MFRRLKLVGPLALGLGLGFAPLGAAAGLPRATVQAMIKALQDTHVDVRIAAAQSLAQVPQDAEAAAKPLESLLMASQDKAEQDAAVQALVALRDPYTPKRLSDALVNPQFTWGAGSKARAVEVIGKVGGRKMVRWLTDLLATDQDPDVHAAALRMLGDIGAPPKKETKE